MKLFAVHLPPSEGTLNDLLFVGRVPRSNASNSGRAYRLVPNSLGLCMTSRQPDFQCFARVGTLFYRENGAVLEHQLNLHFATGGPIPDAYAQNL